VSEVVVPVAGGHLSAVHFKQPSSRGVVFFLHGNAGDLSTWLTHTDFYRQVGFDVFMIDYRGYGKSPGRISSEAQLHADVRAAWELVAPQYVGQKKVIYGRSLGSALAAHLAAEVSCDLLTLVTPFVSILRVSAETYPWVPVALVRYPLRTDLAVAQVKAPVLMFHGDRDELFSMSHPEHLQSLQPRAQLVKVPGAGHNDIHEYPLFEQALAARLSAL
jgi:pimeloyl-ACP methyl ester carboxylesterase